MRGLEPGYSQKGTEILVSYGPCYLTEILQEFWLSRYRKKCKERGSEGSAGPLLQPPQKIVESREFNLKFAKTMHPRYNCIIVEDLDQEGTSQDSIVDTMVG